MTTRSMAAVWVICFCFAIILSAVFHHVGVSRDAEAWADQTGLDEAYYAQTVVIGSSLTGAGIPSQLVLDHGARGESYAVRRWLPLMTAKEVNREAKLAIGKGSTRLLLELRPQTFSPDSGRIRFRINTFTQTLRAGLRTALSGGNAIHPLEGEGWWISDNYSDNSASWRRSFNYSFSLQDTAEIEALLKTAEASNVEVYFLSYPRAEGSQSLAGEVSYQTIRTALTELAKTLNRPLFQPSLHWPDEYFADRTHLNQRGRDRYVGELKNWIALQ